MKDTYIMEKLRQLRQRITFKSSMTVFMLLTLFSLIIGWIGYRGFTEALITQYADGAYSIAEAGARYIDMDRASEYIGDNDGNDIDIDNDNDNDDSVKGGELYGDMSGYYRSIWADLDRLCNVTGSTFIYVIQPDLPYYDHINFLFSTVNHNTGFTEYPYMLRKDTTNDDYVNGYRALYEQGSERETVVRDRGYIESEPHITAMIPLKDSKGYTRAVMCVQRQMDRLVPARKSYIHNVVIVLIALAAFFILLQVIMLRRTLIDPIKKMSDETARFAAENELPEITLTEIIRNRDEIGLLAGSIDDMETRITTYVENLTKITAEKERIATELSLASTIQLSMLPDNFAAFSERMEFDLFASMDPAKEVGGDFYDFFMIDDDHLCIVMADVSGKGIPGALFMMASKIIIDSCAMLGRSAAEILEKTNEAICSSNKAEMFVTVWLGILELSTGKLTAANAGHEYPVLGRAGGKFELYKDKHGFVIGGMDGVKYKEYEITLSPGDKLFLYTDGVPEATDADKNMFGTERMLEALNNEPGGAPEQILQSVREAVDGFVADAEQFDDLTMLCVDYKGR